MAADQPHDEFLPLIGKDAYGGASQVSSVLFDLGCFNHKTCRFCASPLKLETHTKKRKTPDGLILESTTKTLRCTNRGCHKTLSPFSGTIWADIGNRQLFIFAVDSFISRGTVLGVANMTGAKEETITKYFRIIKNALNEEVEMSLDSFKIGGSGVTVQADESHVFKRKNNVGRVLVFTEQGWLFGMVEDTPNGKLFLSMVKQRDKQTMQRIIKKHVHPGTTIFTDSEGVPWPLVSRLSPLHGEPQKELCAP